MNSFLFLTTLAVGIAIGYYLFPVIARWHGKRKQQAFKPVLLQRYDADKPNMDESSS